MKNLIEKPVDEIKNQIEFWFLKYYNKGMDDFDGTESFTFFSLIDENIQSKVLEQLNLERIDLPVLILVVSESEYIVNTTKKFVRISKSSTDQIEYSAFDGHNGFKNIAIINSPTGKVANIKTDGLINDFGLRKKNKEITYWKVPTGKPGFAFWNVTNKCELIGRKYKIIQKSTP